MSGRHLQVCKSVFTSRSDRKAEGLCDHCGGLLYQREDDRPESIAVRLDVPQSATAP
jgi:adenylate kinase